MRTEEDLMTACTAIADRAPTPDDTRVRIPGDDPRPAQRPVRRRTLIAVTAATAAAITVPIVVTAVLDSERAPIEAAGTGSPWRFSFAVAPPAGWAVLYRKVAPAPAPQTTSLLHAGRPQCSVSVYPAGAFDESRIPAERTAITVNGVRGYVADVTGTMLQRAPSGETSEVPTPSVVWEYAEDSWALVTCGVPLQGQDREALVADERAIADAVVIQSSALLVPYRIGDLPDGWSARSHGVEVGLRGAPQPDSWLTIGKDGSTEPDDEISVLFTEGESTVPPVGTRLTVDGRPAWLSSGVLTVDGEGFELRIQSPGSHRDRLIEIAQALEFAPDPLEDSTWFDGTVAIP